MKYLVSTCIAATFAFAAPARAEFLTITSKADFVTVVAGKTLTRPLVKLQLNPNGQISGKGAAWDVIGKWEWKGNYLNSPAQQRPGVSMG